MFEWCNIKFCWKKKTNEKRLRKQKTFRRFGSKFIVEILRKMRHIDCGKHNKIQRQKLVKMEIYRMQIVRRNFMIFIHRLIYNKMFIEK